MNAKVSAQGRVRGQLTGPLRTAELAPTPTVTGTWATPIQIDPFTISVEEKLDHILYWEGLAGQYGGHFPQIFRSSLVFIRQERVVATSEGTLIVQTLYESGGHIEVTGDNGFSAPTIEIQGLVPAGRGWELILDAQIPDQLAAMPAKFTGQSQQGSKPSRVGRYTLVCDGAAMAALVAGTLGVATQLDRALGYEANAGGTSFIDDPLAMVGQYAVASPLVTVTANRSTPTQLATVKWDDEGVESQPFTLVKNGVLVDFQTTREQAVWLAPYYGRTRRPLRSNGCAAAEDALVTTLQMMPNLALEAGPAAIGLDDLVSDVKDGILITGGKVETDFQARTGLLRPAGMREIKNGRLGRSLFGGAVQFTTAELWHKVVALGGAQTTGVIATPQDPEIVTWPYFVKGGHGSVKGEPSQATDCSVQAVAATITDQAVIDPTRKA